MTFPSGRLLRNISIAVRPVVRHGWYSETSMTRSPPAGRLSSDFTTKSDGVWKLAMIRLMVRRLARSPVGFSKHALKGHRVADAMIKANHTPSTGVFQMSDRPIQEVVDGVHTTP